MRVRVYTDGACSGNPGPGGWAAVFTLPVGYTPISGYELDTTNNRMELMAVIESLTHLLRGLVNVGSDDVDAIDIHSDSAYVVNAVNNGWIATWAANGWITKGGKGVKNQDLWKKFIQLASNASDRGIQVTFVKVKGHAGNTFNEIVDKLAVSASTYAQSLAYKSR